MPLVQIHEQQRFSPTRIKTQLSPGIIDPKAFYKRQVAI